MPWEVEFTEEFRKWCDTLGADQQEDLAHSVGLLAELGPSRGQSGGRPLRTLYAFDPVRTAILLIGGEKTGDDRWYETFVPIAERIFEAHLDELRNEEKL